MSEQTQAPKKKFSELSKDEKIAFYQGQIAALTQKLDDVINDVVRTKPAKAAPALPKAGDEVLFLYGRRTNTTEPTEKLGKVLAVKPETLLPADASGKQKRAPAQIKIQVGQDFDIEIVTVYPGAIKHVVENVPRADVVDPTPAAA